MVFNAVLILFQFISWQGAPIHAFPGFLLPVLRIVLFSRQWLLSCITIAETVDSSERRMIMNPVAITNQSSERILAKPGIEPSTPML